MIHLIWFPILLTIVCGMLVLVLFSDPSNPKETDLSEDVQVTWFIALTLAWVSGMVSYGIGCAALYGIVAP